MPSVCFSVRPGSICSMPSRDWQGHPSDHTGASSCLTGESQQITLH